MSKFFIIIEHLANKYQEDWTYVLLLKNCASIISSCRRRRISNISLVLLTLAAAAAAVPAAHVALGCTWVDLMHSGTGVALGRECIGTSTNTSILGGD